MEKLTFLTFLDTSQILVYKYFTTNLQIILIIYKLFLFCNLQIIYK